MKGSSGSSKSKSADGWRSKKQTEPPRSRWIASHHKEMVGDAWARFYRTEAGDLRVWAHLHGLHRGRHGKTKLGARVVLVDSAGKVYWKSPAVGVSIGGALLKSESHKHRYGRWPITGEALAAHQAGTELRPLIAVTRVRHPDVPEKLRKALEEVIKKLIEEYMNGEESPAQQ